MIRDYQLDAIKLTLKTLKTNNSSLNVMATGAGKTYTFFNLISLILSKKKISVLIVTNKTDLVTQASSYFDDCSMYCATLKQKQFSTVTIGTIQSLINADLPHIDLVVVDEVHRFDFNTEYTQACQFVQKLQAINANLKVVGYTATPFTQYGPIYGGNKFFKDVTFRKTLRELTPEYLVPLKSFATAETVDLSNVKLIAGEYNLKELALKFTADPEKVQRQVSDAIARSVGRQKIIVVTTCIAHAELVYNLLPEGSKAIVHSRQNTDERTKNMEMFKNGPKRYLVSVLVASEGLDIPEADCLWLMRPTKSKGLFVQAVGRILRKAPNKKDGLLLDYGRCLENLGSVYDIDDGIEEPKPVQFCDECYALNRPSAKECRNCGTSFLIRCGDCYKLYLKGTRCECKEKQFVDRLAATKDNLSKRKLTFTKTGKIFFNTKKDRNGNPYYIISFMDEWGYSLCNKLIFRQNLIGFMSKLGHTGKAPDFENWLNSNVVAVSRRKNDKGYYDLVRVELACGKKA